jgi:hypothetical protein
MTDPQDEFLPLWAAEPEIDGWPLWSGLPPPAYIAERDALRAENERLRGIVPKVLEDLNDGLCKENETLRAELAAAAESLRICRIALAARDAAPTAQPEACFCDRNNLGVPGVSCGDCPTRDYKQAAPVSAEDARDAARYRWLRETGAIKGVIDWNALGWAFHDLAAMDAAIDAALAAKGAA